MDSLNNTDLLKTALVLEGGALRGVFTCGVLDWMMDNDIQFPYVVGVSAGACNGASFISRQRGRARYSNIELLDKYKYVGLKHYIRKRNVMDFDLLFDDFPNRILPFDFETYGNTKTCFEMVVSNCLTGEAEYMQEYNDHNRLLDILKASSSMPIFSPVTDVDGVPMLDGGVCDSIPVERALSQGYQKMVVVVTRNKGYRKKSDGIKLPSLFFRKYPKMREAINQRNEIYNHQLDMVERLESEGLAVVIRPLETMTINRIETNTEVLTHFYNHGYDCAAIAFRDIAVLNSSVSKF
ncbi:patatin-like phospholipase family protein [Dysgonomonas macrotermitis]|uniref:Predicted phospholipase, patatin/cPLA2 family n=1 Tax=Dysgonomonas macrotermitis TaxID=1346286 RepID=A0A1M5HG24_9BACT|nr:patatin family protein [Dysgonomonas macrotermitis]SHG14914.1 Predicted phospholipase, patatin/cPLA2 family [Dysgonomonas macrotermitis]